MLGFKGSTQHIKLTQAPRGYLERLNGETPPRGPNTDTVLYTVFDRKGIPFVYVLPTNDTPFTYQFTAV